MRHLRQFFVCSVLAALAMQVGCGAETPDGVGQASEVGSISLALVGTSVTGATYRLSNAWFELHGPTNRLVDGSIEAPVITEVLPVGHYDVYLEPYWVLERWTGVGYQPVQAVLTSPNPLQVFINEGTTSTVVFQFRADDELVSVGQGSIDIVIGVDDAAAPREDTDAACGNGYDDDEDGLADCADPECQGLPLCAPPGIAAQFTDTLGDDIPAMWPAVVLADATDADDIVLECRECADCGTLRWSLASVGFSQEQISEMTYYFTTKEEVVAGEEDIMHWPAGCVDCFGTSCYPQYNFLYWSAGSGLAHFHLTETAADCSSSVWNVMGPRDTNGAEGNLCGPGVVGGISQYSGKVGEWFQISIVNPR
ncbi:hypothetical protein [Sorangium sp. So ce128]|uniref:hypothetical protein n=1 Tax=Sorangium sp. So ce128 TaxID=3133281 RepID=UPI003F602EB2